MICHTVEECKQKVIALASNPQQLQEIKDCLKTSQLLLFDVSKFVSSLETAYLQMI
jgi:predicted O-linked N-acetylglucosamine transferase (SPINDLY family)